MSEDQYRKGVSVVVCCYNSSARLPETLNHLMNQTVPNHIEWEVVIVDNKSTDNTIELCNSTFKANKFYRYKIVSELNQGLSYARKKGLDTALYDYIIYCDDDNWLDSNYIANAYRLMSYNTNIGACGGIGQPVTDNDPPKYFKDFAIGFAVGEQGNEEGPTQRDTLYGAGLIVRKSILVSLYNNGFVTKLSDRKGNNITSCGDSELTLIIK